MKTGRKTEHGHCARGQKRTKEYTAWIHMKRRCYNKNYQGYARYGGRGIVVCERWLESFENFYQDMGLAPSPQHSLDRVDPNGNYKPDNCKWSNPTEQSRNTRSNVMIEYNGETKCLAEWAKIKGFNYWSLVHRIKSGWAVERALNTPTAKRKNRSVVGFGNSNHQIA